LDLDEDLKERGNPLFCRIRVKSIVILSGVEGDMLTLVPKSLLGDTLFQEAPLPEELLLRYQAERGNENVI